MWYLKQCKGAFIQSFSIGAEFVKITLGDLVNLIYLFVSFCPSPNLKFLIKHDFTSEILYPDTNFLTLQATGIPSKLFNQKRYLLIVYWVLRELIGYVIIRFSIGQTKRSYARARAAIKITPQVPNQENTAGHWIPDAAPCTPHYDWLWTLSMSMALLPVLHLEYEWCWPYATY